MMVSLSTDSTRLLRLMLSLVLVCFFAVDASIKGFTDCLADSTPPARFFYLEDQVTFSSARNKCTEKGADINSITSKTEFKAIRQMFTGDQGASGTIRTNDQYDFWVGIRDKNNIGGAGNTNRFSFIDPDFNGQEGFFRVYPGEGPWDYGEPDDFGGNQNCVVWKIDQHKWDDKECNGGARAVVCRLDCSDEITAAPTTADPTTYPTKSPTRSSNKPTSSPSKAPITSKPSKSPTHAPLVASSPSNSPTRSPFLSSPTKNPTDSPTSSPLRIDVLPTKSPTRTPTLSPVVSLPTVSPTLKPTISPLSIVPSTSPTQLPTYAPTSPVPSTGPTASPTRLPTRNPTSHVPSTGPTASPTRLPTRSPTSIQRALDPIRKKSRLGLIIGIILALLFCSLFTFLGVYVMQRKKKTREASIRLMEGVLSGDKIVTSGKISLDDISSPEPGSIRTINNETEDINLHSGANALPEVDMDLLQPPHTLDDRATIGTLQIAHSAKTIDF